MLKAISLILTAGLFVGSFFVIGYSFEVPGYEALIFAGGIMMSSIAWMIPMYILPRISK